MHDNTLLTDYFSYMEKNLINALIIFYVISLQK